MERNDREYVVRALRGDKEAYGALVDAYQGMVFATALNITGNYTDSQDIVQEVFLRAYQRLRVLSDPSKFASWLHTIARRIALQFLKEKRRLPAADAEGIFVDRFDAGAESAAEAYARKELNNILWNQVAELPPKTREAILLYYMEGFSIKRAAAFLGISEGAMKMRLSFGREKLRESLMGKIEGELRQHQPSRKTRNAILAALPAGGAPPIGFLGLGAAKGALPLLALSAKQMATIAAIVIAGLATTLIVRHRPPQAPVPHVPPVSVAEKREDVDRSKAGPTQMQRVCAEQTVPEVPAEGHAIRGRMVEKLTREPIPRVAVCLEHGGRKIAEAITDARGEFELTDLADGRYELYPDAKDPSVREQYYFPEDGGETSVNVSGQDVEDLTLSLLRGTYISGIVVDQDDRPVEGASLQLEHHRYVSLYPYAQSEPDGTFKFGSVFPGQYYKIVCEAPGYAEAMLDKLETSLSKPLEDVIIQLVKGGGATISGWVINKSGQPVENALVQAWNVKLGYRETFLTTADGMFSFPDVPPGNAWLHMEKYGKSLWIDVEPNEIVDDVKFVIDQEVQRGYVSGVILGGSGEPIADGMVFAQPPAGLADPNAPWHRRYNPADDLAETVPDEQGEFKLANLKPGTTVDILYRGPSGPRKATSATSIPVPTDGLVVMFETTEPELLRITVRGKVIDRESRQPIERFAVCLSRNDFLLRERPDWFFDHGGRFEIEGVLDLSGRTYLYAEADGYAPQFKPVNAAQGAEEVQIDVYLGAGGSIDGRVVNIANRPVEGARVFLRLAQEKYVLTDAGGAFALTNIREGRLNVLSVSHPDYPMFESESFATDENTVIRNYIVRLGRGATITGRVLDDSGNPFSGTNVDISVPGEQLRSLQTDAQGLYIAERLPPGQYRVTVPARYDESKQVVLEHGEVAHVNFGAEEEGSTLSGTVYLAGAPLPLARVIISDLENPDRGDELHAECRSDQNGYYLLAGIPAGSYFLMVYQNRVRLASVAVDVPESGHVQRDITVPGLWAIRGRVVKRDGSAAAGVLVSVLDPGLVTLLGILHPELGMANAVTDHEGHFALEGVGPGQYIILTTSETLGQTTTEVQLEPAHGDTTFEVTIVLDGTAQ